MKKLFYFMLTIMVTSCFTSCTEEDLVSENVNRYNLSRAEDAIESTGRLCFDNESDLLAAIENESLPVENYALSRSSSLGGNVKFVSLMEEMPSENELAERVTYYEALGYDTLVPNPNFAKLLNIKGEMEVNSEIIRIVPEGTFRCKKGYESEIEKCLKEQYFGTPIDSITNKISNTLLFYRTFEDKSSIYTLESLGDETEYPEIGEENPNNMSSISRANSYSEPDFNSFAIFSADRKTWIGKFIQSIIGASKTHTIKFNSKRRIKGSFYFYNYGVYAEIGVKGWTDKKNWIGWSKTASDELRVGWNHVVLRTTYPDNFKNSMQSINSICYNNPQITRINGKDYKTATLIMPQMTRDLKDKILTIGAKAVKNYLKSLNSSINKLDEVEAFLIATRTEVYFVAAPADVIKYNTKYYCHVFDSQWMDFQIGWSNNGGFFIGNVNQNNVSEIGPWIQTAVSTFNQKKTKLIGGEVYVCGRFDNVWKGMKIIKKSEE